LTGKELRLSRIFRSDGKVGVFAFDHGQHFGTVEYPKGPIKIIQETVEGGIDALLLNPGMVKILKKDIFRKTGELPEVLPPTAKKVIFTVSYMMLIMR